MSENTGIEWTGATWNPFIAVHKKTGKRGWFCTKPSNGCKFCYAEAINKRLGTGLAYTVPAMEEIEIVLDEKKLNLPLHWKRPRRIFVNSMSDLFHESVPLSFLQNIWRVMVRAHRERGHIFQVLTKRPQRMLDALTKMPPEGFQWYAKSGEVPCPEPGIWLGVSIEDQPTADERIPLLLQTPAAVRFISYEPALGPLDLMKVTTGDGDGPSRELIWIGTGAGIDWLICGGESGHNARPMQEEWARSVMLQCKTAGVAFFMKQGSKANWSDYGNFESFPKDLQIREFPTS